jgi:hypothetical protein
LADHFFQKKVHTGPFSNQHNSIPLMKKYLFSFVFCAFLTQMTFAQRDADFAPSVVSVHAGLNGWQIAALSDNIIGVDDLTLKATGTYSLTYDYAPIKWFSVGGSLTYNRLKLETPSIGLNIGDRYYEGSLTGRLNRTNVGVRLLGHYVNNERFDLYSGLRVGANIYRASATIESPDFEDVDVVGAVLDKIGLNFLNLNTARISGTRPTLQVIPLGFRFYVTDRLGIGAESALGPTQYLSANVNFRF